jgi:hypothetical protein
MSAFLAVRDVFVGGGPNHDALISRARILKQLHFTDGELPRNGDTGTRVGRVSFENASDQDPDVPGKHGETRQREKFRQLPAVYKALVSLGNGELLAPKRLSFSAWHSVPRA